MSGVVPPRVNYEQRAVGVLKAMAVNSATISAGDLAWAINYQRVSRSLGDMLMAIRPILEDNGWPPLTCLVLASDRRPLLEADRLLDVRMQQRRCYVWAMEQATERQRLRGTWLDNLVLGGDSA